MFYDAQTDFSLFIYVLISPFSDIPVYISTYDNDLNEHNNNQFGMMTLPNATTTGILCEKGKNYSNKLVRWYFVLFVHHISVHHISVRPTKVLNWMVPHL